MSKDYEDIMIEIQVLMAKLEERIITLFNSNDEVKNTMVLLRREQETRFRWTVYIFVALLAAFLALAQLICRWTT